MFVNDSRTPRIFAYLHALSLHGTLPILHQRQGIEQEPTVRIGPGATAMERRAEQVAAREGRAYEPVTAVGQHNARVVERACLRQDIEGGKEWVGDVGQRIAGRLDDVEYGKGWGIVNVCMHG